MALAQVSAAAKWSLAEGERNGLPFILRYMSELPDTKTRANYGWLTVISWSYAVRGKGMPQAADNTRLNELEGIIHEKLEPAGHCILVISRTGNGQREWSYYIRDRDEFIAAFNDALADKPRFPIEITFYEDPQWSELRDLHRNVKQAE
jgi:hypothetical protein